MSSTSQRTSPKESAVASAEPSAVSVPSKNAQNTDQTIKSEVPFNPFSFEPEKEDPYYENCQKPDFIYGGPFIKVQKPDPFIDTATPMNVQLQGTFKQSFAYYSLKERMPVILTKVIDSASRSGGNTQNFIQYMAKLKNDLVTNKNYDKLSVAETDEAKKWNEYIEACDQPKYFTNNWCFTECYIYRRIRDGVELCNMQNWDPFQAQKESSFSDNLEPMCIVAERLVDMLPPSEKDKRKADFVALLKICLWSNKCDMSLSLGEPVGMPPPSPPPPAVKGAPKPAEITKIATDSSNPEDVTNEPEKPIPAIDPFQLIVEYKDKLLVDDSNKIADQIVAKAEKMAALIAGEQLEQARIAAALAAENKGKKGKAKPPPPPPPAPLAEGEAPPPPPAPCPAKVTVPSTVQFDIICDNAGYELFTDLCLAHFLISQNIVKKVRFHVKAIPWFVSDVTPPDFTYVIDACANASYSRTIQPPEPKPVPEGQEPPPAEAPRTVAADALRALGAQWKTFLQDGTFELMSEDFWTSPHVYKDMKRLDYWLYRKLQMACGLLFKGDLNYRKLVGERRCNPYAGFEASLQGFIPAPIIALRTVKSDTVCGLPRGRADAVARQDANWMRTGNYGVIQFCAKAEPLKVADRPCAFYCGQCMGLSCPEEGAFW